MILMDEQAMYFSSVLRDHPENITAGGGGVEAFAGQPDFAILPKGRCPDKKKYYLETKIAQIRPYCTYNQIQIIILHYNVLHGQTEFVPSYDNPQ